MRLQHYCSFIAAPEYIGYIREFSTEEDPMGKRMWVLTGVLAGLTITGLVIALVMVSTTLSDTKTALAQSEAKVTKLNMDLADLKSAAKKTYAEYQLADAMNSALLRAFWQIAPSEDPVIGKAWEYRVAFQKHTKGLWEVALQRATVFTLPEVRIAAEKDRLMNKGVLVTFSPEFLKAFPDPYALGGTQAEGFFYVICQTVSECPGG